jgi:hypothetical protein
MRRRRRGSYLSARSTKGWARSAPTRTDEIDRVLARCGRGAFLDPSRRAYPIVGAYTRTCSPDCRGLRAAFARARQQGKRTIAAKALRKAKEASCGWAR